MADPAMEHHCLKGFPDVGELRTILLRKKRVNPAATKAA